MTEKNNSCKNPYSTIPLIKWSKQAKLNNILLLDTQACGKTTKKSKGTINTIVQIADNAKKKAWGCTGGQGQGHAKVNHIIGKVLVLNLSDGFLLLLGFVI